jgi:hypothetical protein
MIRAEVDCDMDGFGGELICLIVSEVVGVEVLGPKTGLLLTFRWHMEAVRRMEANTWSHTLELSHPVDRVRPALQPNGLAVE